MGTHYSVMKTHNPLIENHDHLWKPFFLAKVYFHKWLVGVRVFLTVNSLNLYGIVQFLQTLIFCGLSPRNIILE